MRPSASIPFQVNGSARNTSQRDRRHVASTHPIPAMSPTMHSVTKSRIPETTSSAGYKSDVKRTASRFGASHESWRSTRPAMNGSLGARTHASASCTCPPKSVSGGIGPSHSGATSSARPTVKSPQNSRSTGRSRRAAAPTRAHSPADAAPTPSGGDASRSKEARGFA